MANKHYLLFILTIALPTYLFGQNATLKGQVTDATTKETLIGAYVRFDGSSNGTTTDVNGQYALTNLKPGFYKVKVTYIGYTPFEKEFTLSAGQVYILNISLATGSNTLKVVSIHGKLDNETESASRSNEKNSNNIKNVISAQAIARSPDINAANVLQRVSGVTIQRNAGGDDAYPIIRGIEPRYNNTLINGVKIASPESQSRFVSLSIVPSELLQRIEVSKTLTPEMEGDAIGGTVNLVFKDAPEKRDIVATGSIGYSQLFIDRKFTKYQTKDIQKYSPSELNGQSYNATADNFSRSNLDFTQTRALPTTAFSVYYAERFLKSKLGVIIGNNYQNLYYGSNSEVNTSAVDGNSADHRPIILQDIVRQYSTNQKLENFITHLDFKINDKNKISLDNVLLYSHLTESATASDTSIVGGNGGRTIPGTGPISYVARSTNNDQLVENLKLSGNHILSKHFLFDWTGAYSDAGVRNPDQATLNTTNAITYDPSTKQFTTVPTVFDGISRIWQHNNDKDVTGIANLTYTKSWGESSFFEFKVGGLYRHKKRYNFGDEYSLNPNLSGNRKEGFNGIYNITFNVFNPNGSGGYNANNYDALENVTAYFGQFKFSFPMVDIIGGVRSETTLQEYTLGDDNPYTANSVSKQYTDILPSIDFKFKLSEKTNLRASYFKSIARPSYSDLIPVPQPSSGGEQIVGNPGLLHTTADSYDIRFELFPKQDEQFYVGTYYKKLTNLIETKIGGVNQGQLIITPKNTNNATVAGVEFVATKYIGKIGISGNYAYTYSDVLDRKIDRNNPALAEADRPFEHRKLSGASIHDLNVSLLYRDIKNKINLQLAYQFLGSTLVQIYDYTGDDYIQKPQSVLAFSGDAALNSHIVLFGKFNNLLNTHKIIQLHDINTANEFTKATYLLGLRYNY